MRPLLSAAAWTAARFFRLLPRAWRFPVALRISLVTAPLFSLLPALRAPTCWFGTNTDEALRVLLRAMEKHGVAFEPNVDTSGATALDAVTKASIFVSAHFSLNACILRVAFDRGWNPIRIAAFDVRRFWGTSIEIETIVPSRQILVRMRTELRRGRSFFVDIDTLLDNPHWPAVRARNQTLRLSPVILQFAARSGIPVFFFCAYVDRGRPCLHVAQPSNAGDPELTLRELVAFLNLHAPEGPRAGEGWGSDPA